MAVAATAPRLAEAGVLESGAVGEASGKLPSGIEITAAANDRGTFWTQSDGLTLSADAELDRTISFRATNLTTPLGEMEIRGGVGRSETSDALTFERLQWANRFWEDATVIGIGATHRLAGGRLTVSSDLSWSTATSLWRDDAADASLEAWSQAGFAAAHKFDAKLFDEADFKWSLSGTIATASDGYRGNAVARPQGTLGPSGDTQRWMTKLESLGSSLAAALDRFDGRLGTRDAARVTFATDGLTLAGYGKTVRRRALTDASTWASAKDVHGVELEIEPASLGFDLPQSALMPARVMLNWETGAIAYPGATDAVETLEAMVMWETAWGDTTALYTAESQARLGALGAFEEENVFVDLSHSVKFGAWRVSAGADVSALTSTSDDERFAYDGASYHFALRYAPTEGAQFESRLGRSANSFALDDDFAETTEALTLTASLDLSDYVRRQLSRDDLSLKLQYRQNLTHRETDDADPTARTNSALLVSFSIEKLGLQ